MADGLNRVQLLGNLGADSELRTSSGGTAILSFRVGCSESYLDRNKQRQQKTEWVSCTLFGKRAEGLAQYMTKGTRVFLEGSISTSSYEDRNGNKKYSTKVIVSNVILCGGKSNGGGSGGSGGSRREERSEPEPQGDDFFGGGSDDSEFPF